MFIVYIKDSSPPYLQELRLEIKLHVGLKQTSSVKKSGFHKRPTKINNSHFNSEMYKGFLRKPKIIHFN